MARRHTLLALILLAFALRLHHLDVQSLWYDEGVTAQVARLGLSELARWTADDIQPPLYYMLVSGWLRLNPFGELILRWPSAAFGTLLIPLLWALGRRLWDERAGLLAALVAAASPVMVYYGQEARMYTLLISLVALAALALLRWEEDGRRATDNGGGGEGRGGEKRRDAGGRAQWGARVLYALAALAALYTHYFALFALLALALHWLIRRRRDRAQWLSFLGINALVGVGYLPWAPAMLTRFQADASYWTGRLKVGEALLDVLMHFTLGATEVMAEADARAWLAALTIAAPVWLYGLRLARRRSSAPAPALLIILWGLLPALLILVLAYRTPKFNPRYLLISWPAWALLVGGGLSGLWAGDPEDLLTWVAATVRRLLALAALLLVLAAHAVGLLNWFANDNFAKSAWREGISEMYFQRQADEAALLLSGHAYPVFDAYLPPRFGVPRYLLPEMDILNVRQVVGWAEAAQTLNRIAAAQGGVWLFTWQDEVIDPSGVTVLLLDRFADAQPTPALPYLGLRHYRFRPGQVFPARPPGLIAPAALGGAVQVVGAEATTAGVWLYWQALQPDLPDLQVAITLRRASGQILAQHDLRPAGYDFPTTRWQMGEIYPHWLAAGLPPGPLTLEITLYDSASASVLGVQRLFLTAPAQACAVCG
ncbi:MAG: glycosyltransferase family 39 protein [Caldilineales bacterium]|nr:glycosyltransferase family 39 protein [Caldilineales bacterium]